MVAGISAGLQCQQTCSWCGTFEPSLFFFFLSGSMYCTQFLSPTRAASYRIAYTSNSMKILAPMCIVRGFVLPTRHNYVRNTPSGRHRVWGALHLRTPEGTVLVALFFPPFTATFFFPFGSGLMFVGERFVFELRKVQCSWLFF